jgi:hypothetical protein
MDELALIELFCTVDNFCKSFEIEWQKIQISHTSSSRWWLTRVCQLSLSEIMTIAIWFHRSRYRTFKDFYLYCVQAALRKFFPKIVSYARFVSLMKRIVVPLFIFQQTLHKASDGIAFIDSTVLSVCHICRASSNRVFRKTAAKGKTTTGWFFGFKLHLIVNHRGELTAWQFTQGNVSDLKPVPTLTKNLLGKLFGDKGYISHKMFAILYERGLQLITRLRSNMKNVLMDWCDKLLLRKRGLVESVINNLKSSCQIEHHRHRSPMNFIVNLIAGLAAYCCNPNKPCLKEVFCM